MKKIKVLFIMLVISVVSHGDETPYVESNSHSFTYQNPITSGISRHGLRDCQVFRDGEFWYLTGTGAPFGLGSGQLSKGIPLYKSKNLIYWTFVNIIVKRPEKSAWYYEKFWAPEIHHIKGKYYAILNCRNVKEGYTWQHIGYAVASHVEGPYTVVTKSKPIAEGNDLTFFIEDNGDVYAFWHTLDRRFGIGYAKIDLESGRLITTPRSAVRPGKVDYIKETGPPKHYNYTQERTGKKISKYYSWDSMGIEGAYVIKRKGTYYLFYSSWQRGYEMGYATSSSIHGPWEKAANNPVYSVVGTDSPFSAVGHNEVFTGVDGRLWLSCHGSLKGKPPFLVIDPIDFDPNGRIIKKVPTHTPQTVRW
jgi:beta-xylosidase